MKKILLLLLLTCSSALYPQALRQVLAPSYFSQTAIQFTDENTGYTAGLSETIYKTTDGGATWNLLSQNSESEIGFNAVKFFDNNTGLVAGGKTGIGLLKKTTDGGSTWTEIPNPAVLEIEAMQFLDEMNGWIVASSGSAAEVYRTTDGGTSWESVLATNDEIIDMFMHSSGKGIIVGGSIDILYYTTDGVNWLKSTKPTLPLTVTYTRSDIRGVYMVDENLAYACGWGSAVGLQPNLLLKTTDGGATWIYLEQAPENRVYQNLHKLYFKDADNGIAVGGGSYEGSIVVRTTDGGTNWVPIPSGLGFSMQNCIGSGDQIWVVGNSGGIAYSSDFGTSWELKTPVPAHTLYNTVIFGNDIISAGFNGYVAKSTDRGNTWLSTYAANGKVCPTINGIHFLDANTGFAARNNNLVSKTTDGGLSWTALTKDTNSNFMGLEDLFFFDETNGFVVGRVASSFDAIYRTTDGGINWSLTSGIVFEDLKGIDFFDANNGIAVGNDSKIMYTTNGGESWSISVLTGVTTDIDIFDVDFISASNAVAVGQQSVFLTADGGATWEKVDPGYSLTLDAVVFKDENNGWAVGDKFILKTTNGGRSWVDIKDTLVTGQTDFYGVSVDENGDIWVTGSSSSMYTTSPFVGVKEEVSVPVKFALSQNYPNPFNPETSIKYSVASDTKVSIRIYDILGKLVSELVNGQKPAGEYKVSFNAAGLSSGIYLCVMNADGKVFTSKMTLIK